MFDDLTPKTAPLVIIEWSDIVHTSNWNEKEVVDDAQLSTCGWLLEDSERRIVIAGTYDWTDESWAEYMVLPKIPPEILRDQYPQQLPPRKEE